MGSYCLTPDKDLALAGGFADIKEAKKPQKISAATEAANEDNDEEEEEEEEAPICHYNWAHVFSMANKIDH